MNEILKLTDVSRSYGRPPVRALSNVSLSISIVGPSGSGKSTLLNLMGTLDQPSSGSVLIDGEDVSRLSDTQQSALRAYRIGFVFQQFHLMDGVKALDNVANGLLYHGLPLRVRRDRARTALERVGMAHRLNHRTNELSGGERQRVAIARAVVGNPPLVLADEPTGNLDTVAGERVVELLYNLNSEGTAVIVITHDNDLAARMPRRIALRDGALVSDSLTAASSATPAGTGGTP